MIFGLDDEYTPGRDYYMVDLGSAVVGGRNHKVVDNDIILLFKSSEFFSHYLLSTFPAAASLTTLPPYGTPD